jgi:hypothetical protein
LTQIPYRNRTRVKVDIETVTVGTRKIGSLFPKIGNFVHVDGAENKLVFLGGTIPIFYGGATYNIPVDIYIPVNYPNETPFVYVRPTGNMIIKQNHRHVDMNGFVYLPYLHEWNSTHSLLPLIEVASSVFSIEPPLFTKPAATATTNTTPAVTPTVTSSAANARATGYGGNASIAATATPYAAVSSSNNTPTVVSAVPTPVVGASYPYAAVSAVPAVSSSVHGATANHSYYGNGYASNQYAAIATPATTATANNNNYNNNNNATTAPNGGYSFGGLAFAANFARNLTNSNAYDVNTNANVNNAAPSNSSANNAYYPSSSYGTNYAAVPVPVPVAATTNTSSSSSSSTGGNYLHHHAAANTNTNTSNSAALSLQTSQQNQVIAQQIAEKRHRLLQDVTYAMRAALQAKYEACRADILREMANEQYLQRSKEQLEALRQSIRDEELPKLRAAHQTLHEKVTEVRRLRNPAEPQPVETTTTTTNIPAAAASTTMTTTGENGQNATATAGDETKAEHPEPAAETSTAVLSDAESINNNNNDNNNNNKATAVVVVNLEDNLLPTDDLSVQITKLQGDLQGCRDIFYVYEQALLQHRVDLKVFGKDVRDWARQEFLCKAHLRKIERIAAGSVGKTV